MIMKRVALTMSLAFALMSGPCLAQSHSPYAGFEKRTIKALSDQQINDLRAGLGLSLALAAELNGYPGPRHTLEFAKELTLSEEQRVGDDEPDRPGGKGRSRRVGGCDQCQHRAAKK